MMSSHSQRHQAELDILSALPGRAHDLARLGVLAKPERLPVVTAIGKYNHGKSRLLNELTGQTVFSVADRRETVVLAGHEHEGVWWLDAPGLDADVAAADDGQALQAIWLKSDIRLFVHAAREGELDAAERSLLISLHEDQQHSMRQTLLVLSQIDQMADEEQLAKVVQAICAQLPALDIHQVSSTRHHHGLQAGKKLLLERSGIPALKQLLAQAVAAVPQARRYEAAMLHSEIQAELQELHARRQTAVDALCLQQAQQGQRFAADLAAVLDRVAADIQAVLDVPGPDHSLTPDSFANQFKITPGKLERNRLQMAYSGACIKINAILLRHGATELPLAQQSSVRSLDNAMVAVMGVYVKYRKDLRQIFCEVAGRERLRREFIRYFELSADRLALVQDIASAEGELRTAKRALSALSSLGA